MFDGWSYQHTEGGFYEVLPEGDYRIRVASVTKKTSKKGKPMIEIEFAVSGRDNTLRHYITFLADRPEITNRNLTNFYLAFPGIPEGNSDLNTWVGKVGACRVEHETYINNKGQEATRAKISYFLRPEQAAQLPAWQEPSSPAPRPQPAYIAAAASAANFSDGFAPLPDGSGLEELPF